MADNTPISATIVKREIFAVITKPEISATIVRPQINVTIIGGGKVVGGGTVEEVVAGNNIEVDNTDPSRPIVSATGGGIGDTGIMADSLGIPIALVANGLIKEFYFRVGSDGLWDSLTDTWASVQMNWDAV